MAWSVGRDVAPWVALSAALDLAAWLALPLAAGPLGAHGRWGLALAAGGMLRAVRGAVGAAAAVRTRPRVMHRVASMALSTGDPDDPAATLVACFALVRAVEGAVPALLAGALAAAVSLVLALRVVDVRAVVSLAVGCAVLGIVRVTWRGAARTRLDRAVAAQGVSARWLSGAARGRHEITGAARGTFLTAVASAGRRWAAADGQVAAWRRWTLTVQLLAGGGAAVATGWALDMDPWVGIGLPAGAGHWLALAAALAPGLSAARALDEILAARRTVAALSVQPPAPMGTVPWPLADAVVLHGVTVNHGASLALSSVSLTVPLRGVTAVVGPNGAGKSTLAMVLAGRRAPDTGTCTVDGVPMATVDPDAVAVVPQQPCLVEALTVLENIWLAAPGATEASVSRVLGALGLTVVSTHPVGALSRGEQRRIAVARALLRAPRVLVLDEPDAWLDRAGRDTLAAVLAAEGARRAVVLVTHRADLVRWVDRVVVLSADHTVEAVGTPAEVATAVTYRALTVEPHGG